MTQPRVADALLHPIALLALVALGVNDHVLKGRAPGWLTGKLSDVAGMIFFPLVLWALIELAGRIAGGRRERRAAHLYISVAATGLVFAAIKLFEAAGDAYAWTLAALQWPFRAAINGELPPLEPVAHVVDPTDLIALPALGIALWIGRRYLS